MKNSPRVLVVANSSWYMYNFRLPLMLSLSANGWQPIAVAPEDGPGGYADKVRDAGFSMYHVVISRKGTNLLTDLCSFLSLRRLYGSLKPAAVLHFTIKPNIYGSLAAGSLGIPAVNNISGLGTVFITENLLTRLVKLLYRISQRRACRIFFQNGDDRELFLSMGLVPKERTALLPGSGVDLKRFSRRPAGEDHSQAGGLSPAGVEPGNGRGPAGEDPNPAGDRGGFRFLFPARLLRDKGIYEYVQAARLLVQSGVEAKFSIAGQLDPDNRTSVSREELDGWTEEGQIEFLGNVEDMPGLLNSVDCVVLPSYREGTPRSLLEAAACSVPIVTTDVPGCRQTVDEGRNGFLCSARSAEALADAMERMYRLEPRDRRAMGEAGREKMEREYDQELVFRSYEDALRHCSGAPGRSDGL